MFQIQISQVIKFDLSSTLTVSKEETIESRTVYGKTSQFMIPSLMLINTLSIEMVFHMKYIIVENECYKFKKLDPCNE